MKKIIIAFVICIFVCSTAFAVWTKQEEVDDFGDKTGKVTFFLELMKELILVIHLGLAMESCYGVGTLIVMERLNFFFKKAERM